MHAAPPQPFRGSDKEHDEPNDGYDEYMFPAEWEALCEDFSDQSWLSRADTSILSTSRPHVRRLGLER